MHKTTKLLLLLAAFCLPGCTGTRLVITAVAADDRITETIVLEDDDAGGWSSAKVAQIDVTGMIADRRPRGVLSTGENPVDRFTEALRRAEKDRTCKAVLLRINSPGGTVTASDLMYRELESFRQRSGKPVVALLGSVAASGGYYLACGADEIIAQPTTVTGSIGVIIQTVNVADGMSRIGIRADAITSGPNKSMGSPFQPMPAEHRELLQGIVDEFYGNFRDVVVTNRPAINAEDLDMITDGRVVTGRRAAELGLVDSTGALRDAFARAKELAGVEHAKLVKYHRPTEYVGSAYARAPMGGGSSLVEVNVDGGGAGAVDGVFLYLWDPSVW